MKLRFPLNASRNITVIGSYVPTLTSSDDAKETFCDDLNDRVRYAHTLGPHQRDSRH